MRSKPQLLAASAYAGLALMWSQGACAQDVSAKAPESSSDAGTRPENGTGESGNQAGLGEIVVTARKTTENLQRAPASIVAIDGDQIVARGISDPQALEKVLPSANLRRQGPITQVFIRGVGTRTDLPNFAQAAAFLYNGLVVQRYGTFGLTFDLGRVESIAGPQGTLYGGNAAGGAINLFSAQPANDFSGYAQAEFATYNSVHLTGAQNAAIGNDLSLRAAFDYNRRDAYYSVGMNKQNNWSGRLAALWRPSNAFKAHLFYSHGEDHGLPVTTLVTQPLLDAAHPYRLPLKGANGNIISGANTRLNNRNDIVGANIDFTLGDNQFTYIPGYVDFTADYEYYSGGAGNLLQVFDRERQISQELRWNREAGALKLSAGVFYLRNHTNFNDSQVRFTSPTASSRVVLNITDQINESYAGYAQAILSLSDRMRLTAGGRLTHDRLDAEGSGANKVKIDFHRAHTHPDWKVGADFDLAPDVLVYANVQTGYIPFGYNPDVFPNPEVPESKLFAVSGGFKSRFAADTVELNVEGFHYNYDKFQAIQFINTTGLSTVLNADKSTIVGVDVSFRAKITPHTRFDASAVLQRARYDRFEGVGYNFSGNKMINAPDVNLQFGFEHAFQLGSAELVARADSHFEGGHYSAFTNFPNSLQRPYSKTDLSLAYRPIGDRWNLTAFVRNVENSIVFTTLSPGTTAALPASTGIEAPRTFGVRLGAKW